MEASEVRTTMQMIAYVLADTIRALIGVGTFVLAIWFFAPRVHWIAATLFWIGATTATLRGLQMLVLVLSGVVLWVLTTSSVRRATT